jgi:hypothetical protein
MATASAEGFRIFLDWCTPTAAERSITASHRESVFDKLAARFDLHRMYESGSFKHGTGLHRHSDVDYIVSLKSDRPATSATILSSVRSTLMERFPTTAIKVSRPAVVVEFGAGSERVEVIPAYPESKANGAEMRYRIPGMGGNEWMWSTPEAHSAYVNDVNGRAGVVGGAKKLARLAKAWKYYRSVPISSFYLEMRAAEYMAGESSISWPADVYRFLSGLHASGLAGMNDPTGSSGRFSACSTEANRVDALSKLERAVTRARNAYNYKESSRIQQAFEQWDLLWNGRFPSYG